LGLLWGRLFQRLLCLQYRGSNRRGRNRWYRCDSGYRYCGMLVCTAETEVWQSYRDYKHTDDSSGTYSWPTK
ncbi:MAG: hypothetical protein AB2693_06315, partial [Candidatus Thiodiazotropha sp.]